MKKLVLISALSLATAISTNAQSFDKNKKVIDAGIRIAVFDIEGKAPSDSVAHKDKAASSIIPLQFEYGVGKRIGVQAEFNVVTYFTSKDTIKNSVATANGFDFSIKGNFHWLRAKRVDLFSGIGIGYSSFKYHDNSSDDAKYKGSGSTWQFNLITARFYLSEHVALGVNYTFLGYSYPNGRITSNTGVDTAYKIKLNGQAGGFAFSYKW